MTLQKIALRSGINREGTRYTNEGGWYDGDKIRFRQGTPEKIGGWERVSDVQFQGVEAREGQEVSARTRGAGSRG